MCSYEELLKHHELTEEDCDREISDKHLALFSLSLCNRWKMLPAFLGVTTQDLDLDSGEQEGKRYRFLLSWKRSKSFLATYKKLITSLLALECAQDANEVMLKLKASLSAPPEEDISPSASNVVSIDEEQLELNFDRELSKIIQLYTVYVKYIRESLQAKGKTPTDLASDLMNISAFRLPQQKRMLLSAHEEVLRGAKDLNTIFDLLSIEYASFLNIEIFQHIVHVNNLDQGQEELQYPKHLDAYILKHQISEFVRSPQLKEVSDATKEIVLKFDIESTARLAKVNNLRKAIARIFDLDFATIRLLDLKEGCVEAKFLLSTPVAEMVFNKVLTERQIKEIQALPILSLKCNGRTFNFTDDSSTPEGYNQDEDPPRPELEAVAETYGHIGTAIVETPGTKYPCNNPSKIDSVFSIQYIVEPPEYGKWMIFKHLDEIDDTWKAIQRALDTGRLQKYVSRAKCTTKRYNPTEKGPGPCTTASINVFLNSSEDRIIDDVGRRLIQIARQDIKYKKNEDTHEKRYAHAGAEDVTYKTLYWNNAKPSYERKGRRCPGTTKSKEDVWKINVVEAPEPFLSKEIYGWWVVRVETNQATEMWYLLKRQIESGTNNPGVIKMECIPKIHQHSSEKPRFHIYTSNEDKDKVEEWLKTLVKAELSYKEKKQKRSH